jgi:protein SCO1/2
VNPTRRLTLLAAATLLAGLAGCDRGASPGAPPALQFKGVDITGAEYGRKLDLPDADGKPRTLADFKGKVTVVFFGYTQCPDVCPTTMVELAQVKKALGADGDRIQGIFVTVDPERDKPEVLKAYMSSFDPSFVALRGTPEQIQATAKEFKVFYGKVPGKTEGSYTMDHTAGSYVFDAQGRLRLFVRYGSGAEALTADLKTLLAAPA